MSSCIAGREVEVRLRDRKKGTRMDVHVICPARWSRSRLLAYVRQEHPDETAVITTWHPFAEDGGWRPNLWIVNPEEMAR